MKLEVGDKFVMLGQIYNVLDRFTMIWVQDICLIKTVTAGLSMQIANCNMKYNSENYISKNRGKKLNKINPSKSQNGQGEV